MNILLTGGTGYIGSHTAIALSEAGYKVVLLDNYWNSSPSVLKRLDKILGKSLPFIEGDVRNTMLVSKALQDYKIDAVIHFAGLKAVSESVSNPLLYYANNIEGSISLLQAMQKANVKTLVFSSSATVYGEPKYLPVDENHPTSATSPYGRSKLYIEEMLRDVANSCEEWKIICLRYFNPVGAHDSGLIGEDPSGVPNNLMPYIAQVASRNLLKLNIYGGNYPTRDGTGIRDYIDVMDLADGHLATIRHLDKIKGWRAFNLGAGRGYTVLEVLEAYERAVGEDIAHEIQERRPGDVASSYANVEQAKKILLWSAKRTLDETCITSWKWQNTRIEITGNL